VTVVFTVDEVFVPRVLSVTDPSTPLMIESDTEVCVECSNIRTPQRNSPDKIRNTHLSTTRYPSLHENILHQEKCR
jgi:hypothetical protein